MLSEERKKELNVLRTWAECFPIQDFAKESYSSSDVSVAILVVNRLLNEVAYKYENIRVVHGLILQYTQFGLAPASSRYHQCCAYGLLMHSIGVAVNAIKLFFLFQDEMVRAGVVVEDVIVAGLYHDLYKAGWYGGPAYYISMSKKTKPGEYKIEKNDMLENLPSPDGSIITLLKAGFVGLTPILAQAIFCHDGLYSPGNREIQHSEHPLTLILHWADYATYRFYEILELGKNKSESNVGDKV